MRHTIVKISAAAAVCGALFLLQGCGAAVKQCADPQLDIPETIIPGGYADTLCLADLEWSEIFSDPLLKDLIQKTLDNSRPGVVGNLLRPPAQGPDPENSGQ